MLFISRFSHIGEEVMDASWPYDVAKEFDECHSDETFDSDLTPCIDGIILSNDMRIVNPGLFNLIMYTAHEKDLVIELDRSKDV